MSAFKKHPQLIVSVLAIVVGFGAIRLVAQNTGRFRSVAVPEPSGPTLHGVSKGLQQRMRQAGARGQSRPISVIVRLTGESLAAHHGAVAAASGVDAKRLDARSGDSAAHLSRLNAQREAFKNQLRSSVPGARVVHEYAVALHGLSAIIPDTQIEALAAVPGVEGVYEDEMLLPQTEVSPGFIGAPQVWNALGGQESAGENVVVGMLDTGIWPEHPSFSDPDPAGKPYGPLPGGLPPGLTCDLGPTPFSCNNKLIGARTFLATYAALIGFVPGEFSTARDNEGHGTHTTSTAAGNAGVSASIFGRPFGTVSGIAPRAKIIAYKVCGVEGCFGSDSAAAVDRAILDGVDVINFSISGGANPYADAVELAFLDAYAAGVFVSASAGNSGPTANTTDHRGPWTMTVAASTGPRQFKSTLTLTGGGATLSLDGASVTHGIATPTPVVIPAVDTLCMNPAAPGTYTGKIVVCERGGNARVAKGFNVVQGGAAGMILRNPTHQGLATDNHFLPAVQLENTEGNALLAFLTAHPGTTATFTDGSAAPTPSDVMADFSSRGGTGLTLGVVKPDITAPGVQILAGNTPAPSGIDSGAPGQLFQAIQGTSMSSPHIAGSAALMAALHPTWTPGQIKSALMMSADPSVVKEDGITPADVYDFGSGRVDLGASVGVGFTIDETAANYVALENHLWDANYPSMFVPGFPGAITSQRTLRSLVKTPTAWVIDVTTPPDLGVDVPRNIHIPGNGTAVLSINLDGHNIPDGASRTAILEFKHGNYTRLRFPITVVRGVPNVPLTKNCTPLTLARNGVTECTVTATNPTFNAANVAINDQMNPKELRLVSGSTTNATEVGNGWTFNGTLAGAQPPTVVIGAGPSPAGGYLPLSAFGVAPIGGVGDDTITNFNAPSFPFAGEHFTRLGVSSNGYVVIGTATSVDNSINNQHFPDPARPNNVLAPFWTDLNPGAAGAVRIATLTDGADTWIVVDWQGVREFSTASKLHSFEIWIGIDGDANPGQDVSYAFGPNTGNGDGGFLSVGAENRFGNRGGNTYFNGTGTLPTNGTQLIVTSAAGAPGETRVITFQATGQKAGPWQNCATMTSSAFAGTQFACVNGTTSR